MPCVLDVPMELGLELMAIVGPHLRTPEGDTGNDVIDERSHWPGCAGHSLGAQREFASATRY